MPASAGPSSRPESGTATPVSAAGPSSQPILDLHRPLAKVYFKPLEPFLPPPPYDHTDLSIPALLDLPPQVYHSRLANRHLFLNANDPPAAGPSGSGSGSSDGKTTMAQKALKGKKRSRGDEAYRREVRRALDEQRAERERKGLVGERKRNRALERQGKEGAVKAGAKIEYNTIVPLHHLHTTYLAQLLSLPPLPPDLLAWFTAQPVGTGGAEISPPPEAALAAARASVQQTLTRSPDSILSHLSKASFLGAELRVRSARNSSLVGISGLCISETASTFALIPRDNTVRIVPKAGTQFTLTYPAFAPPAPVPPEDGEPTPPVDMDRFERVCPKVEVDFLGSNFGYRSGDRAGRKFRPAQGGGGGSGWGEDWVRGEWSTVLDSMGDDEAAQAARGGEQEGGKKQRKKGKSRRKDPPSFGRILE